MIENPLRNPAPTCYEVWGWPEFKAFAERLGIPYNQRVKSLEIILSDSSEPVRFKLEMYGD